jgi:hypothetical protein
MKRKIAFLVVTGSLLWLIPVRMQTQEAGVITIRLSYKVVLNPADGTRPLGVTDGDINDAVTRMNNLMSGYLRGYRFQVVEILDIGGVSNPPAGPSQWYNTNFFDENNGANWKDQIEAAALADPAYQWRNNAINLYITNGICGGICSFPNDNDEIVIIGGCSDSNEPLQLHEIGHYFSLCHTQGCPCENCTSNQNQACNNGPVDDGIADTLPDRQCWTQDNIAQNNFGRLYAQLTPAEQQQVDDVFLNIMSYHANAARLTEQQLDRWSQSANVDRIGVRSGRMIFAQPGAPANGNGSPANPFNSVSAAVASANSDPAPDIIILRPSSFNQTLLTGAAVTFRATRNGSALIGSSAPPSTAVTKENLDLPPKAPAAKSEERAQRLGFAGAGKK